MTDRKATCHCCLREVINPSHCDNCDRPVCNDHLHRGELAGAETDQCDRCCGMMWKLFIKCHECDGDGEVTVADLSYPPWRNDPPWRNGRVDLQACARRNETCPDCNGEGWIASDDITDDQAWEHYIIGTGKNCRVIEGARLIEPSGKEWR